MSSEKRADQYDCTDQLLSTTPNAAVVANLGVASYVLAAVADRERNFYCWGSMGSTTAIGLGVALVTDHPITVLEGDGSLLMSLGTLTTVADQDPSNLTIVVWNNSSYATTGGQPTFSDNIDLAAIASGCGLYSTQVDSEEAFAAAYDDAVTYDGAAIVICDVAPVNPDTRPPLDYAHIKHRFKRALVKERGSE